MVVPFPKRIAARPKSSHYDVYVDVIYVDTIRRRGETDVVDVNLGAGAEGSCRGDDCGRERISRLCVLGLSRLRH